jgi:membrane-associated protein
MLLLMPYRVFLPWSMLGGMLWSVYTCGLVYLVGSALDDFRSPRSSYPV